MRKENYVEDDAKGREIFDGFCQQEKWCKVNKYGKDRYTPWDVAFQSASTLTIGEIKVRDYESRVYDDWYLQVDKYEDLIKTQENVQQKKNKNTCIVYINFFKDNICYIWDLNLIDMTKIPQKMVQIQKNNYSDEKVWKLCYCMPHNLASKFETNITKSIFN